MTTPEDVERAMKMPTPNQLAILRAVAANEVIISPVVRAAIRKADGVSTRGLTTAIASCIERGWLKVPQNGWEAYALTLTGRTALESL